MVEDEMQGPESHEFLREIVCEFILTDPLAVEEGRDTFEPCNGQRWCSATYK